MDGHAEDNLPETEPAAPRPATTTSARSSRGCAAAPVGRQGHRARVAARGGQRLRRRHRVDRGARRPAGGARGREGLGRRAAQRARGGTQRTEGPAALHRARGRAQRPALDFETTCTIAQIERTTVHIDGRRASPAGCSRPTQGPVREGAEANPVGGQAPGDAQHPAEQVTATSVPPSCARAGPHRARRRAR